MENSVVSSKIFLNKELLYDPAIISPVIDLKKIKTLSQKIYVPLCSLQYYF